MQFENSGKSCTSGLRSANPLEQPLRIGGFDARNRSFLAPMSGVSDAPFRRLAWRFGAGLVVSEMVASEALVCGLFEMELKAQSAGLPMHIVQLAGREAKWMALAAKLAEANGADVIDINMGCPSKRVTTGYSGSALMRDLDHATSLIEAVTGAVNVPVTLKMRLGWDAQTINAPELARRAENCGVSMITVHGRTRCQFYKGNADWGAIRPVREATRLPLVVNGDICGHDSAVQALRLSGGDAVMIGRASYGRPWLAGEIAGQAGAQLMNAVDLICEHHEAMLSHYGAQLGIRQARKHLGWYLTTIANEADERTRIQLMTSESPQEIQRCIKSIFDGGKPLEVEPGRASEAA
ncbi:MAG: tRNA dihydrouridine synthase DusB [Rhizobiaceae bacterium]